MRVFNRLYPASSDLESDLLMSEGEMLAIFTAPLRQSAARLTPAQHCHLPRLETLFGSAYFYLLSLFLVPRYVSSMFFTTYLSCIKNKLFLYLVLFEILSLLRLN